MICKLYIINNVDYYICVSILKMIQVTHTHLIRLTSTVKGGPETMLTHSFFSSFFYLFSFCFFHKQKRVRTEWMVETVVLDSISTFTFTLKQSKRKEQLKINQNEQQWIGTRLNAINEIFFLFKNKTDPLYWD